MPGVLTITFEREITIVTPGIKYTGNITVPKANSRTIDIINSPNRVSYHDSTNILKGYIALQNAKILEYDGQQLACDDFWQVKLDNILFFHDNEQRVGTYADLMMFRKTAGRKSGKSDQYDSEIEMVLKKGDSDFFLVSARYHGNLNTKMNNNFLPLSAAFIKHCIYSNGEWQYNDWDTPHGFVAAATKYIESCSVPKS